LNVLLRQCSRFFDTDSMIWNSHGMDWTRRDECILDGPHFLTFKTVLSRTYDRDNSLEVFFSNILEVPCLTYEDILHEVNFRRDSRPGNTSVAIMRDLYAFLASKASSDDDWRAIK
jgi:hypothetical protein